MRSNNGHDAGFLARAHQRLFYPRRMRRVTEQVALILPSAVSAVHVGAGDGSMAASVRARRPDVLIRGVETEVPGETVRTISIDHFDGTRLPYDDESFHVVMFVDCLHRTPDRVAALREAMRVAKRWIVIKDYLRNGLLSGPVLRTMHNLESAPNGFPLSNYWPEKKWKALFDGLGLRVDRWETELHLYPFPARVVFDRDLHFIARLAIPPC